MNAWTVAYSVTGARSGAPIAGGIAVIHGSTLEAAMKAATVQLRERYESPRARVQMRSPEPYTAADRL